MAPDALSTMPSAAFPAVEGSSLVLVDGMAASFCCYAVGTLGYVKVSNSRHGQFVIRFSRPHHARFVSSSNCCSWHLVPALAIVVGVIIEMPRCLVS